MINHDRKKGEKRQIVSRQVDDHSGLSSDHSGIYILSPARSKVRPRSKVKSRSSPDKEVNLK